MSTDGSTGHLRVEVWMRDLTPPPEDPRRSILARLRDLEAAGRVDAVSVNVWGRSVLAPENGHPEGDGPVRKRIAEFRRWADRNDHSLEPAFRRGERSTMLSADRDAVIRLPLQCLAVYEDDRLVGVFPCSSDGGTRTVADCVARLETGELLDDPAPG